jgi:diguanylate cyclase (GGDEF)-like protein
MKNRMRLLTYSAISILAIFLVIMILGMSELRLSQDESNEKEMIARALMEIKSAALSTIMLDPLLVETNQVFKDAEVSIQHQAELVLAKEQNPQMRAEFEDVLKQWKQYDKSSRQLMDQATHHLDSSNESVVRFYHDSFKPLQFKIEKILQRVIEEANRADAIAKNDAMLVYWILFPLLILICIVVAGLMIVLQKAEGAIRDLAFLDPLTHLANRRQLLSRLEQSLAESNRNGMYGALLYLDMDKFKSLNDIMGHQYGDKFLCEVANRLKDCVRTEDTIARIGGDEFCILLENIGMDAGISGEKVRSAADKIIAALGRPYALNAHKYYSTASVGISLYHEPDSDVDVVLNQADSAMYEAKHAGGGTWRFYEQVSKFNMPLNPFSDG